MPNSRLDWRTFRMTSLISGRTGRPSLRELKEVHAASKLDEAAWQRFLLDFSGDVGEAIMRAGMQDHAVALLNKRPRRGAAKALRAPGNENARHDFLPAVVSSS
jgi:hypothetical protein